MEASYTTVIRIAEKVNNRLFSIWLLFRHFLAYYLLLVGKTRFERATWWSQTTRSTKLSHFPINVFYIGCVAPFNPCFAWSCTLGSTNCLPSYPLRHFCIAIGTNIKNYKIRFFLFVLYQLSYLPMTGRVRFELTTTDFADQRKILAVRILMAVLAGYDPAPTPWQGVILAN